MLTKWYPIETNPTILRLAQKPFFKLVIVALYSLILTQIDIFTPVWRQVLIISILAITLLPKYRYLWLIVGMLTLMMQAVLVKPEPDWIIFKANYLLFNFEEGSETYIPTITIKYVDIMLMLITTETLAYVCSRFRQSPVLSYPIGISYFFMMCLILIASYAPLQRSYLYLLWSFIAVYNHYFWFTGYTLLETSINKKRNFLLDYARYLPIWGFTAMPYGKGSNYLSHVEAKNSEDFAITQIKGLKLAVWAFIFYIILHVLYSAEARYHLPRMSEVRHDYVLGAYYSVPKIWLSVWEIFFRRLLELTVMGHYIVSACRMCGFRILRNTYRPLQAPTIAEYWNRYNYYFKELLVAFFFYPTFFRFFKNFPRLRIFFATLASATFGNMLFHFLLLTPVMMSSGFFTACKGFVAFAFYAIVLGVSIGFSQLYNLKPRNIHSRLNLYIISPLMVLSFYSVLGIFNTPYQRESFVINFKILGSLFNINW
jgi:hypothetical protein